MILKDPSWFENTRFCKSTSTHLKKKSLDHLWPFSHLGEFAIISTNFNELPYLL